MKQYIKVKRSNYWFSVGETHEIAPRYVDEQDVDGLIDVYLKSQENYFKIPADYVEFYNETTHPELFL